MSSALPPQISDLVYNSSYNPGQSLLTFTSMYGSGTDVPFDQLQDLVNKRMNQAIMFGVRCGAATLTIIIMWMVSKKKRTPIFIINQISLFLILLHSAFYFKYLFSGLSSMAFSLTGFPQAISRSDIYIYGATNIFQVLLVASIEASLLFQLKVMFTGVSNKRLGRLVMGISASLGICTIAMYLVTAVKCMIALYQDVESDSAKFFNISTILLSSSINFMTFVLIVKLFVAIRSRRFLGLKQFDSFHILLIMSFQSLLIPSIIFILAYSLEAHQGTDVLTTVAILLVVLSLPLSSLWATSANNVSVTKPMESDFTPSDAGFYPNNDTDFGSQSVNTDSKSRFKTKLYNFYSKSDHSDKNRYSESTITPTSEITKFSEDNGKRDLEKNAYFESSADAETGVYTKSSSSESSPYHGSYENEKTPSCELSAKGDRSIDIYTPDTLADEEARCFWRDDAHLNE